MKGYYMTRNLKPKAEKLWNPAKATSRDFMCNVTFYVSQEDRKRMKYAAKQKGLTLSEFIRRQVMNEANLICGVGPTDYDKSKNQRCAALYDGWSGHK
jgi:hypothetical protein